MWCKVIYLLLLRKHRKCRLGNESLLSLFTSRVTKFWEQNLRCWDVFYGFVKSPTNYAKLGVGFLPSNIFIHSTCVYSRCDKTIALPLCFHYSLHPFFMACYWQGVEYMYITLSVCRTIRIVKKLNSLLACQPWEVESAKYIVVHVCLVRDRYAVGVFPQWTGI